MKSILKQLYDGEIMPSEQFKPHLIEYRRKWNKIGNAESAFTEKLTEQQEKEQEQPYLYRSDTNTDNF